MIAKLTGIIDSRLADGVILMTGGVGYQVYLAAVDQGEAQVGQEATYLVYEHLREDTHQLYGFSDPAAKALFTQLLSVSGIGPKVALGILSAAPLSRLRQAIAAGDADLLKGVAGVGKKTAERVVVELKSKMEAGSEGPVSSGDGAYQALLELGYSAVQAAEALATVPAEVTGEEDRLRTALQGMTR